MSSSCMVDILLVCGKWEFQNSRYVFLVDKSKGSHVVAVDREIGFGDLLQIVYEEFRLDQRRFELQFSYMLSKKYMQKLPKDTPPVFVGSSRQFAGFLRHFENETIRLCIEITEKALTQSKIANGVEVSGKRCNSFVDEESEDDEFEEDEEDNDDDEEERYDNCEDPDGASSSDEDYDLCGKKSEDEEEEEDMQNLPPKKRGFSRIDDSVELEMKSVELAVGQCYDTKEEFETRLKIYAVANKMDFDVGHSTPTLLTVRCWVGGCKWRVRASTVGDGRQFYVKTYYGLHTCSITMRSSRARQATPEILGRLYKDFVGGVGNTVTPNHVSDALTKRYGIKVEYWKAYRVLKYARELVTGSSEDSYEDLPSYLYMIRRANPGTLIKLEVDSEDKFKFMFLAFSASIQGFPFMRKVVVVDGTFLTGKYKGTLLIATTQDGNFNIFPIAFGIVDTENDESWEWFFAQLHRVIPDDEGLAIISDRHRSIGKAITKIYPLASRGICTYHLHKNILVKYKGGEAFRLVKKAATTYRLSDFNVLMAQIQGCNRGLYDYLQKADVQMWSRVHFPGQRYNFTTSNIAESLNKVLSKVVCQKAPSCK
ncbi:protein FAR1-RELATED SEQUENCE 6-like [Eutrema salsugineum]|uniref:protein FAR1-RELATED SEQUENCE 6-like n=1 Tax=Eutrema salsugineum TaxID=72664 RepID=UPI000CED5356|nr:protein FAR1-RELATED SEQUENCE 6-like [Eutrema salsugineum]